MRIALIGCGAIGSVIADAIIRGDVEASLELVYDLNEKRAEETARRSEGTEVAKELEKILTSDVDLVVEAASQQAVKQHALKILGAGKNLMVLSVGALVADDLLKEIKKIAREKAVKVYIPSGAIGGLDALKSASIADIYEVSLTTTKPPRSLGEEASEKRVLYEGNSREAIKRFPVNINVSAALSLAGLGFDKTKVTIVADPAVDRNTHEIKVRGEFGEYQITVENVPSLRNPKTSYLAALSAVAALKRIASPIEVGN
ncbi:MAG: aspartate dehydrogenase [Candidatus Hydrothermarchaeales archaeon]